MPVINARNPGSRGTGASRASGRSIARRWGWGADLPRTQSSDVGFCSGWICCCCCCCCWMPEARWLAPAILSQFAAISSQAARPFGSVSAWARSMHCIAKRRSSEGSVIAPLTIHTLTAYARASGSFPTPNKKLHTVAVRQTRTTLAFHTPGSLR